MTFRALNRRFAISILGLAMLASPRLALAQQPTLIYQEETGRLLIKVGEAQPITHFSINGPTFDPQAIPGDGLCAPPQSICEETTLVTTDSNEVSATNFFTKKSRDIIFAGKIVPRISFNEFTTVLESAVYVGKPGSGTFAFENIDSLGVYTPGDANFDGMVDALDLNVLGQHWQQKSGATWETADFNNDNEVNPQDLNAIGRNWQKPRGAAVQMVPEPQSNCDWILVISVFVGSRRPRRPA